MRDEKRVLIVYWVNGVKLSRSVLKKNAESWVKRLKDAGADEVNVKPYKRGV